LTANGCYPPLVADITPLTEPDFAAARRDPRHTGATDELRVSRPQDVIQHRHTGPAGIYIQRSELANDELAQ
jgi:hypothetical protein